MFAKPFTPAEIAERLGVSLDTFYRKRERLHAIDGMPRPISEAGQARYERSGMEAWLTRHHPSRPRMRAANDVEATLAPRNDAEWTAFLHDHYGQRPPLS